VGPDPDPDSLESLDPYPDTDSLKMLPPDPFPDQGSFMPDPQLWFKADTRIIL
jgi:hypothetical protein